jgi:hypothetical protein
MIFGSQSGAGDWNFGFFLLNYETPLHIAVHFSQFGLCLRDWHSVKSEQNSDNLNIRYI